MSITETRKPFDLRIRIYIYRKFLSAKVGEIPMDFIYLP